MKPKIDSSWQKLLSDEFEAEYFINLQQFLKEERETQTVYPPEEEVFNAFNLTPVDKVKVVILGQDPYHGPNQAHGLCFSVKDGKIPPSLHTIFRNLKKHSGMEKPVSGNLTKWGMQGVLLLNTALTVRKKDPNSHKKEWKEFTDAVIRKLSDERKNLVFLLWGKFAQSKTSLINKDNGHEIFETSHPAAHHADRTFKCSNHFNETNEFLKEKGLEPIDWNLNTQ